MKRLCPETFELHDLNVLHLVCHVSLWSVDGNDERHTVYIPSTSKEAGSGDFRPSKRKIVKLKAAAESLASPNASESHQEIKALCLAGLPSPPIDTAIERHGIQQAQSQASASTVRQYKTSQTLLGTTVATPVLLQDVDGAEKYFFVFPDLSLRVYGTYRLSFQLLSLSRYVTVGYLS